MWARSLNNGYIFFTFRVLTSLRPKYHSLLIEYTVRLRPLLRLDLIEKYAKMVEAPHWTHTLLYVVHTYLFLKILNELCIVQDALRRTFTVKYCWSVKRFNLNLVYLNCTRQTKR